MHFFQLLKTQFNTLNILFFLFCLLFIAYKYKKARTFKVLSSIILLYFLVVSTPFVPVYLVHSIESKYQTVEVDRFHNQSPLHHIHVLGAGYNLDPNLPAIAQLELITLGRLTEAIRISKHLEKFKIITSGHSAFALESQASVAKRAAVSIGIDAVDVITLDTPSSTIEEATALKEALGVNINLILVTDALHMPRAIKIFTDVGFKPIAAPTNYLKKQGTNSYRFMWWPSLKNMSLMDKVIHEFLGEIKAKLLD